MARANLTPLLGVALVMGVAPALAAEAPLERALQEARLEGQIATAILLNRHLNPFEIAVDVDGDTAILSGTVDAAIERELAEQVARNARGIARVDNRIAVAPDARRRTRDADRRGFDEAVEDATVTAAVKSRLLWNEHTDGLGIEVDTLRGRVTLEGRASSQAEKDLAARLAQRTAGVRAVDNRIEVDARARASAPAAAVEDRVADGWITAKVKSSLLMSPGVDGLDLSVATKDGRVALGGSASSTAERDLAIEIARDIKGVRSVDARGVEIGPRAEVASHSTPDD